MQARSSYQPSYNTLRRPSYPLIPLRQSTHRPVSPPSPIARYYPLDGNRRSVCELVIPEEVQGPSSDLSATLHSHIDLSLEFLKRRHKPKSTLSRTASEPQILSTNTTQPVYIPNSPYVSLLHPSRPRPHIPPAQWILSTHAISMPAFAAAATSTSKLPPPASPPRPCATRSAVSSAPSRTPPPKRFVPSIHPSSTH